LIEVSVVFPVILPFEKLTNANTGNVLAGYTALVVTIGPPVPV